MSPDMQARELSGARAGVFLNEERFDLITGALGSKTELARAILLGMDPKTIYRARRGVVGEEFIARALDVMRQHPRELQSLGILPTFEALFEVREKPVTA